MDLFSGLISYWHGLLASSLIIINLVLGGISHQFNEFIATLPFLEETKREALPIIFTDTTSSATSSPSAAATTTKKTPAKPAAVSKATAVVTPTAPAAPLTPIVPAEQVNTGTRASLVNILCSAQSGGQVRSISGSGIVVDARGVILTNAHIAQYFLLRDYPFKNAVDCIVRTGSPASPKYRAVLLYLPPAWINENASQIKAEHGLGTGEHDYAFLLITESANANTPLPSSYTNIPMTIATPDTGDQALVAGYPAGFLDAITIERNLYATSAFTTIGNLYTFKTGANVDVVSLGGTVVSQGGSSGGAVVRMYDGKLTGLIATATTGDTTAERDLRAITLSYINRSLAESGKDGLVEFLSGNLQKQAADFAATSFVEEKKKLIEALTAGQ